MEKNTNKTNKTNKINVTATNGLNRPSNILVNAGVTKMTGTVKMFTTAYSKQANDHLKKTYLQNNLKLYARYVPFVTKCNYIENLIKSTCFKAYKKTDGSITYGTIYNQDQTTQLLLYTMMLLDIYTNLNIEYGNEANTITDQYDYLKQNGLLEYVLSIIPTDERKEFDSILALKNEDARYNSGSIESIARQQCATLYNEILFPVLDGLKDKLQSISKDDVIEALSQNK